MTTRHHLSALALGIIVLAGCDRQPEQRAQAAGEVLEGTVSDAMIAPDELRSEPPVAPRAADDGKGKAADKAAGRRSTDAADDEAPAASGSPAPVAETPPGPAEAPAVED